MAEGKFRVRKTEAEWKRILAPASFTVLRQEGTERPYTSPLNDEHRKGVFMCGGCAAAGQRWPLYSSKNKYDSHTGWPSFDQPINARAIGTKVDNKLVLQPRTEVHCANCGGHLGHVFNDGPPTTGLRYCMNGVAMTFQAA
jgi:peptide-methionine (R)-S-oxide reductase